MATEQIHKPKRPSHAWIWLVALPPVLAFAGFVVMIAPVVVALANVEKSPGYALAVQAVTTHDGVEGLFGAPVRVTDTKAKHLHKKPASTTLELTFEVAGSAGQGIAEVTVMEKAGRWVVQQAIVSTARGDFGLLADGNLQPIYDPKVLASGP